MPKRNIYLTDIPLDEARSRLQTALAAANADQPLPAETIPLTNALGRVTVQPLPALRSSPHFPLRGNGWLRRARCRHRIRP